MLYAAVRRSVAGIREADGIRRDRPMSGVGLERLLRVLVV
jgi:hypothetical protein